MANVLKITKAGLHMSIQGDYRYGFMGRGIPPSGPMDEFSHHMGNKLLKNDPQAPSIEFAMMGGDMEFLKDTVIAITGGEFPCKINGAPVAMWESLEVHKGDVLSIGSPSEGARGYIAVTGGFDVPSVMGSTSTYTTGFIGGFHGRFLEKGDILNAMEVSHTGLSGRSVPDWKKYYGGSKEVLYFMKGPQYEFYEEESVQELLDSEWKTSYTSNRTAVRFTGPQLKFKPREKEPDESPDLSNTTDDGSPIGCMQTPSGKEIVLIAQDQVSAGGYCKVGVVVKACLDTVGQLKPGKKVRFQFITLEDAIAMRRKQVALLEDDSLIAD